jgi:hypothetical protein
VGGFYFSLESAIGLGFYELRINAKSGISTKELAQQIGVTYKCV